MSTGDIPQCPSCGMYIYPNDAHLPHSCAITPNWYRDNVMNKPYATPSPPRPVVTEGEIEKTATRFKEIMCPEVLVSPKYAEHVHERFIEFVTAMINRCIGLVLTREMLFRAMTGCDESERTRAHTVKAGNALDAIIAALEKGGDGE